MRFTCFIYLLSLSFVMPVCLSAQAPANVAESPNVDYPQALQKAGIKKVRCVFKDSRKFIWIGAENGLYRYDGTNVDILQHDAANSHSLPHNTIVSITEDKAGNIWAGTWEGVARVDAWTFACTVFNKRQHNLPQDFDSKVYADYEGNLWAYGNRGLDRFDPQKNKFIKVWDTGDNDKSGVRYINSLAEWKNDTLVFGTFDGAVLISKKNFGFRRVLKGNKIAVTRVFADNDHKLWLGTWGYGCYVSDTNGANWTALKPETGAHGDLPNVITGITSTDYNRNPFLWISTLQGIYKIKAYEGEKPPKSLSNALVCSAAAANIFADDEQYIWNAGDNVSRFFAGDTFFQTIAVDCRGSVQDIKPVTLDGKTALAVMTWYATSGLTITGLDGKTLYKQPPQTNLDRANVGDIAQDKYHRFWLSTLAGVELLDEHFKLLNHSDKLAATSDGLSSTKTNDILINHDTVWIACYKKGIDLYDLNFHKLKAFLPGDKSGLTDDYVQRIFADSRGRVWLFGNNKLFEYQSSNGKFKSFNFNRDSTAFVVNSIDEMPGGDLIIASGSGLFKFDTKSQNYTKITSPLVSDNNILAVSVDGNGDIWFINAEHLVWYQLKNNHFTLFGHEDGLTSADDLQWLRLIDKKHFYLVANKQIVTFSPGKRIYASMPPRLYFHDVQVNDSISFKGTFTSPLELKYDENRLNIGFGAINYIKPGQNQYAYQLAGVDDNWIYTSRTFASYANLAPGAYTLRLKAANYSGTWSEPVSMTIVISPPFWATWWFRLLAFALVSYFLFIAIRYVLQRNLRERILKLEKEQAVEKERNRIARDMHDDLGSGLTKIAIMSEVTRAQIGNTATASASLNVISTASRELVDNLQDIIWVLNPKNDSLNSLILYIKEYAEGFFEPPGLLHEFICDKPNRQITLSEEVRRNIFLAVKESCNNILKHACCTYVRINIKLNHNRLIISIADNGRGFAVEQVGIFANGLQNIRNRMEQVGAKCDITSVENEGTTVLLTIPV